MEVILWYKFWDAVMFIYTNTVTKSVVSASSPMNNHNEHSEQYKHHNVSCELDSCQEALLVLLIDSQSHTGVGFSRTHYHTYYYIIISYIALCIIYILEPPEKSCYKAYKKWNCW